MSEQPTHDDESPAQFFDAVRAGRIDRVAAMLQQDPSLLHSRDEHGGTALHAAAGHGGPETTRFLLERGADPDAPDAYGNRPLHSAVDAEQSSEAASACLELLLSHGADPSLLNHNGHTPRRHAIWSDDRHAATLLQQRHAPLEGQRPVWQPPEEIIRHAERILTRSWNGRVVLGRCYQLRGDRVLRFEIAEAPDVAGAAAPASVVVKQARRHESNPYDPDATERPNGSWGLFEDWAATRLFASLPRSSEYALRFYGGDREAGVIIIEDLGDGEALVDPLMGNDPKRAEEGLRLLADCLGKLHADTIGQQERYWEYRESLGPRVRRTAWRPLEEERQGLLEGFAVIGVEPARGFEEEFQQLARAMADPGPFLAYVHGDPCPDNCRIAAGSLRLLDFETGCFRHALLDAVYGRILFPSCWCVNRLPAHIAPMMEAVYRARLVEGCPAAADDDRFHRELTHCCACWLIRNGVWMLSKAHENDWRWGISTWQQRVLLRLDSLADTTEQFGYLQAMGATARRCTKRLRELWPPAADEMPLYPAFRDPVR